MSYVGLGASLSLFIDIPIILRSLANSAPHITKDSLPSKFDEDFMALLEAGTDPTDPFFVVNSYAQEWWKGNAVEKRMGPLNGDTIEDAVVHYRKVLLAHKSAHCSPPALPTSPTLLRSDSGNSLHRTGVLLDAIRKAKSMASGISIGAQAERKLIARRVSAFHTLHQACLINDVNDTSQFVPAEEQNTKWMTGTDLTVKDVIGLTSGSKDSKHDGYIHELADETLPGNFSTDVTLSSVSSSTLPITTSGSILTAESPSVYDVPPETDLGFPEYFDTENFRPSDWRPDMDSISQHKPTRAPDILKNKRIQPRLEPSNVAHPSSEHDLLSNPKARVHPARPRISDFTFVANTPITPPHSLFPRVADFIKHKQKAFIPNVPEGSAEVSQPQSSNVESGTTAPIAPTRPTRPRLADFVKGKLEVLQAEVSNIPPANAATRPARPRLSDFGKTIANASDEKLPQVNTDIVTPPPRPARPHVSDFAKFTHNVPQPRPSNAPANEATRPPRPRISDFTKSSQAGGLDIAAIGNVIPRPPRPARPRTSDFVPSTTNLQFDQQATAAVDLPDTITPTAEPGPTLTDFTPTSALRPPRPALADFAPLAASPSRLAVTDFTMTPPPRPARPAFAKFAEASGLSQMAILPSRPSALSHPPLSIDVVPADDSLVPGPAAVDIQDEVEEISEDEDDSEDDNDNGYDDDDEDEDEVGDMLSILHDACSQ